MKNTYVQLTSEERDLIAVLHAQGQSVREIGARLDRNPGTISRELQRNKSPVYDVYLAHKAQQRARNRKCVAGQRPRLKDRLIRQYVVKKLKLKWSPELIAGRLVIEHPGCRISHEAIYQYIYDLSTRKQYNLIPCLARSHRKRSCRTHSHRHKNSHIPGRVSIKERPVCVKKRVQPGHWEADTIISRQSKPALGVMVERTSRYVHLAKIAAKASRQFSSAINRRLAKHPEHLRRSITYDNGSENVEHLRSNKILGTASYFCEPFHSWEKGSVENTIGLVRRRFPKKTDFAIISKQQVKRLQDYLNSRPRKCLNYQTPLEVFNSSVALPR
jgi:IS30 family transposase